MTRGQFAYVVALVVVVTAMVIGSLYLPLPGFFALMVVVFVLVEAFRRDITPKGAAPKSPLTILKESALWQGIGVAYNLLIIVVVAYHLGVERLSFFEKINLPIFLLLVFGTAAGPIAIHIGRTYRVLGGEDDE